MTTETAMETAKETMNDLETTKTKDEGESEGEDGEQNEHHVAELPEFPTKVKDVVKYRELAVTDLETGDTIMVMPAADTPAKKRSAKQHGPARVLSTNADKNYVTVVFFLGGEELGTTEDGKMVPPTEQHTSVVRLAEQRVLFMENRRTRASAEELSKITGDPLVFVDPRPKKGKKKSETWYGFVSILSSSLADNKSSKWKVSAIFLADTEKVTRMLEWPDRTFSIFNILAEPPRALSAAKTERKRSAVARIQVSPRKAGASTGRQRAPKREREEEEKEQGPTFLLGDETQRACIAICLQEINSAATVAPDDSPDMVVVKHNHLRDRLYNLAQMLPHLDR